MKVFSQHKYRLPGRVLLPQGESVVGELPAPAKKYLDGLISVGIVKVLEEPKPAKAAKPEPKATESAKAEPTTEPKAEAPPVEATTRRDPRKATDDK